ncbi:MAG: MCE family protein, partial [Burkholderiales bacterium]|nr:MCE family protein [Burkholderiales bacterium]
DISVDGASVRVDTQSLISVLVGGIAFETLPGEGTDQAAKAGHTFELVANRAQAMRRPDGESYTYLLYFPQSVRGLPIGAPVDFRGVVIGEVSDIGVDFDPKALTYRFPVEVHIYPDRLRSHYRHRTPADRDRIDMHSLLDHLVTQGLRAQLRSDSLLTGQYYVAMDFFPQPADFKINWNNVPQVLPTISGGVDDLQATLLSIAHKIDKMPLESIGNDVHANLRDLDQALQDIDKLAKHSDVDVVPELKATLEEAHRTLAAASRTLSSDSPLQTDTRQTMQEMARMAQALRAMADMLTHDPQAMLRGRRDPPKTEEAKP